MAREQAAEERAAQYRSELEETRRQMAERQDDVFWTALGVRFPTTTIATTNRIRRMKDYSQKLFGDVLTATSLEDFNVRLEARLATP